MFWNFVLPTSFFYSDHPQVFFNPVYPIPEYSLKPEIASERVLHSGEDQNLFINLKKKDLLEAGYQIHKRPWTEVEDETLKKLRDQQRLQWTQIAQLIPERNSKMCYSRYRRLENHSKEVWKKSDDERLISMVQQFGEDWKVISPAFRKRTEKQVKEHYLNYLRPDIKKQEWTLEEDLKLIDFLNKYGKNWKLIQQNFQGRTQNQIKNRFFGRLKRLAEKKTQGKVNSGPEKIIQ